MWTKLALFFTVIAVLLLSFAYFFAHGLEWLMFVGLACLLLSFVISIGAFLKKEQGFLKLIPITMFFLVSFMLTIAEPFQIVRVLTWIKNL